MRRMQIGAVQFNLGDIMAKFSGAQINEAFEIMKRAESVLEDAYSAYIDNLTSTGDEPSVDFNLAYAYYAHRQAKELYEEMK